MRKKAHQRTRGGRARQTRRPVDATVSERLSLEGDTRPTWQAIASLVGVLLVALAVLYPGLLMGWSLPITTEGGVLSDLIDVAVPLQAFVARTLSAGHLPLWFPGADLGLPLVAVPESIPWYPFVTPLVLVFGPLRAIAWALGMHLILAGVGAGMLVRRWGASPAGQSLTALAVAYGLWLPDHFRQFNMLITAAWVPVVWWALDEVLAHPRVRAGVWLGIAGGMMTLGNHLQIVHHTVELLGVWTFARLALDREGWRALALPRLGALGVAAVIALLLAAPHLAPGLEMARLADRGELLRSTHLEFPPHLAYLRTLLDPGVAGTPWQGNLLSNAVYWEEAQYVGLATLVLALFAPFLRGALRTVVPLGVVAITGVILAYGQLYPQTQWLYEFIPGLDLLRFYHRHLWFVTLALAMMGGLGLTVVEGWVRDKLSLPRVAMALGWLAVMVLVGDLDRVTPVYCPVAEASAFFEEPLSSVAFREHGAHPRAFAERTYAVGGTEVEMSIPPAVAWGSDPNTLVEARRLFTPEHASLWGWQTVGGYIGITPSWTRAAILNQYNTSGTLIAMEVAYIRSRQSADLDVLLRWAGALGARWITSPRPLASSAVEAVGTIPGRTVTAMLYRLGDTLPGAWIAASVRRFDSDHEASMYIRGGSADLRHEALLTTPAESPPAEMGSGSASVHDADRPERFTVSVDLDRPGLLVVNSGYHPRWRWSLDGRTWHTSERVNICQLGAWLPAGHHDVHFEFDGSVEIVGMLAGLVGLLGAVGLLTWSRSRGA